MYIPVGFEENFDVEVGATSQGVPYDYSSIMHLRHHAFSRELRYKSTMLPCNETIDKSELGSSHTPTELDYLHINLLYCGGMAALITHVPLSHYSGV